MKKTKLTVSGLSIPVHVANTVVVGAGAAGMACAVRLAELWLQRGVADAAQRVLVVASDAAGGASRRSGSDKQTYYKMGTSPVTPDTAEDFARALTAFGCCHGDTALAEGIASLRGFYNLVESGVSFPHDASGAFVGYKTDHDPYERATSAGPKTSRFMSQCLEARARRLGLEIVDRRQVVEFITLGQGPSRRIVAMACLDLADGGTGFQPVRSEGSTGWKPVPPSEAPAAPALEVFVAENWVLAAGGPGELYAASVYPHGQYGIHGPALLAGLEACNLTESQYGLASTQFRWNVSGTYMQVVPRIFSTNPGGGDEREFLAEYFPDMSALATNIFLKGYQWPFDAQRIAGGQSSLIDMAVHQETAVRGRRVWMDFLRNPVGPAGWDGFSLDCLGPEALEYLRRAGATQDSPIARLEHMNSPAIEVYAENGIDLRRGPLEIAVCAQHNNGGFAVNSWWESNVRHSFVIGEMAGTHGVKRPGGSALNAGQVGAIRASEYIAAVYGAELPNIAAAKGAIKQPLAQVIRELLGMIDRGEGPGPTPRQALEQIRLRMTRYGAHLRWAEGAAEALAQAREQYLRLMQEGLHLDSAGDLPLAVLARQQCLTHAAMLYAIDQLLQRGSGSRGSHCVLDREGQEAHPALIDPASGAPYRIKPEDEALRDHILTVWYTGGESLFACRDDKPRPMPRNDEAFEVTWRRYREGEIYRHPE